MRYQNQLIKAEMEELEETVTRLRSERDMARRAVRFERARCSRLETALRTGARLVERSGYGDAVCVCHLRMGGCFPCDARSHIRAALKETT